MTIFIRFANTDKTLQVNETILHCVNIYYQNTT